MDMDQAAVFLAGSILTVIGFLVIVAGALVVNNLVAKYWKSWGWSWMSAMYPDRPPTRFMTEEEASRIAPTLDKEEHKTKV